MNSKKPVALILALAILVVGITLIFNFSVSAKASESGENINVYLGSPVIANKIIDNLTINGGSPTIQNNIIHTRVIVKGGSPTFINNTIEDGIHADAKGGPVTITNNTIDCRSGFPNIYLKGIHGDIIGNKIIGHNQCPGISVVYVYTSASIRQNQIYGCTHGISTSGQGVEIIGNLIFNNSVGLYVDDIADIYNNTITQNNLGLVFWNRATVQYNNIYNNTQNKIEYHRSINATNNWWGTANGTLLEETLLRNDSSPYSFFYEPFLDTANPAAPTIPPDVQPTPTPQNATVVFLGLDWIHIVALTVLGFAVAVVVAAVLLQRKGLVKKP